MNRLDLHLEASSEDKSEKETGVSLDEVPLAFSALARCSGLPVAGSGEQANISTHYDNFGLCYTSQSVRTIRV